jgi:hypothetical protein
MREAERAYASGDFKAAKAATMKALRYRGKVEGDVRPYDYRSEHLIYIDVMTAAFVLLLKLGYAHLAFKVYRRAWAWSDDPNCSSQLRYDTCHEQWARSKRYLASGRRYRNLVCIRHRLFRA